MGSSGSSHHQCPSSSNGLSPDVGRAWTHSFPRKLMRHHSQPPGHRGGVYPEPPNQQSRLRNATGINGGSVIHNGGPMGQQQQRPPGSLTLPHDLNKVYTIVLNSTNLFCVVLNLLVFPHNNFSQGGFRNRSTSASNLVMPRARSSDPRHYSNYQNGNVRYLDNNGQQHVQDMKRFGSEPDLRHSPRDHHHHQQQQRHNNSNSSNNYHHPHESRYKSKKKYKAPAPPMNLVDGSSPDSYKWEMNGHEQQHHYSDEVMNNHHPPPRKSRLFKTRAETKRTSSQQQQQVSWTSPGGGGGWHEHHAENNEKRWRVNGRASKENCRPVAWPGQNHHQQSAERDRWSSKEGSGGDATRRAKMMFDGKNTLQRSMSSPEFQAELMQVARKVRNKLNYNSNSNNNSSNKRVAPVGEAVSSAGERKQGVMLENNKAQQREEPEIDRNRKINRSSHAAASPDERGGAHQSCEEQQQQPRRQWPGKDHLHHMLEERRVEGKTTPNQEEQQQLSRRFKERPVDFRMASYEDNARNMDCGSGKDDRHQIKEEQQQLPAMRRRARDSSRATSHGHADGAAANDKQLSDLPREDRLSRRNLKEEDAGMGPRRIIINNGGARAGGRKQGDIIITGDARVAGVLAAENGGAAINAINGIGGSGCVNGIGRDATMDFRGQGSGRESTPEMLRKADKEQLHQQQPRRKAADCKEDSATRVSNNNDKRWHDTAGKILESKELSLLPNEKLNRKSDYHESCDKDWEM